ncbi:MAG: hypothetical protein KGL74_09940 [Elusimicrobia bacterium]|nr:hypothetical protein [Elusimicrobiota bacterium]MDE2511432.1 hypothetical protein [Elusimicrobiota bacterium]
MLLVWDRDGAPPDAEGEVLYWRDHAAPDGASIPRRVEDHADRLRAKYLAFIHDLGQSRVGGRTVVEHLSLEDGFSLWWMSQLVEKSPFKSPGIYSSLRLLALEEVLVERKPAAVRFVGADAALARAMRRLCGNLGIGFEWSEVDSSRRGSGVRGLARLLPFALRGAIALARRSLERSVFRGFQKPSWSPDKKAVFFCSYFAHLDSAACARGAFVSRQWGKLPEALRAEGRDTNWIHHSMSGAGGVPAVMGLDWLRRFNDDAGTLQAHAFLDCYLSWRAVARAAKNWLWLNRVAWRLRNVDEFFTPNGSAAWLWPLLRDDWWTSLTGPVAAGNCVWIELFEEAMGQLPPQRKGVYLYENQGWEYAMLRSWRRHGHGEIVGYAHTTVPFWHLYYFNDPRDWDRTADRAMPRPDRVAVSGAPARKLLTDAGFPTKELVDVEALRYNGLAALVPKPARVSDKVEILVLGDVSPRSMERLMENLAYAIRRLPAAWRFTFKPHPLYDVPLAGRPRLERVVQTDEPLDRILGRYDFVVAGNSTSAAVDAHLAGLPVVIELDGDDFNLSPLRGRRGARFAGTAEEFLAALRDAVGVSEKADGEQFFFLDPGLPRWRRLLA